MLQSEIDGMLQIYNIKSKSRIIDIIISNFCKLNKKVKIKFYKDNIDILNEEYDIDRKGLYIRNDTYAAIKENKRLFIISTNNKPQNRKERNVNQYELINLSIYYFILLSAEEQKKIIDNYSKERAEKIRLLNL
jgi:hypothetical protein